MSTKPPAFVDPLYDPWALKAVSAVPVWRMGACTEEIHAAAALALDHHCWKSNGLA